MIDIKPTSKQHGQLVTVVCDFYDISMTIWPPSALQK